MRSPLGPSVVMLGAILLSGCALSRNGSLTQGVSPATGAIESDTPTEPGSEPLPPAARSVPPAPRALSVGTTVESTDVALATALFKESLQPSAETHFLVAEEYRRLGVFDAAHERLTRTLEKAPRLVAAHDAIARLWRDWGLPHEALGAAYRAAYFDSGSARTLNTLATVFDALGQSEQARDIYQRAVLTEPTAAWALNNLCYLEFRLGSLEEASRHCEAALRLDAQLVAAHNNLALTYAAAGDFARARREFRAAGDPAAAAYNLGLMHLAAKEYLAAAEAFEQAIEMRPNFSAAKTRAHAARMRVLIGSN